MKYSGEDTKSRFRILKGGKISLVVSALLVGASLVGTDANAAACYTGGEISIAGGTTSQCVELDVNANITVSGTLDVIDTSALTTTTGGLDYITIITNNGIISNDNNGDANGVYAQGRQVNLTNNSGSSISATSTLTARSVFMDLDTGTNMSITNAGIIDATSTGAQYASGIHISAFSDLTNSSITNTETGTITVNSADSAYGIYSFNGKIINTTITNNGTINATANNQVIGIRGEFLHDSSILNNGTITVTGGSGYGIQALEMYNNSTITNDTHGVISVYGESGATDIAGVHIGTIADSTFTNRGTVSAYIDNALDTNAYSIKVTTMGGTSTVENTSTGKLYGNLQVLGTMSNAGLISLPHNATNAFVGNFTNESTGTLEIGLLTDGTHTTHSKLPTNNATFENGSTIKVNVLANSTNVALLKDTRFYDVVSATDVLTVNGTLNVTDNSALLNFTYEQDGNFLDLIAVEANDNVDGTGNIFNTSKLGNGNSNALNAASALDTIQAGNNPQMNQLFTQLNQLPTDEAVAAAAESLTPQTTSASFRASTQISNNAARLVDQRQQANFGGGLNSGDEMFASKNIWLKTYGSIGKQNDKDGLNGFDVKAYGLGMGIDGEYKDNQKIGVAFFYTKADLDVNNLNQSSDMDVFTTLVYGNVPIIDDKTNFLYQLGYAWQQTSSNRTLFTGQTAFADYTSKTASVDLKLLRDYEVNKSLLLQPMVSTTYRHFDNPSYSETDAGANGLNVDAFTSSQFLLGVGALAHYKLDNVSKIIGNVNVAYDTVGDNVSVTSAYQGSVGVTFDTADIDNGRWQYEVGLGYEREVKEGHNLNISYNYQGIGEGFSNNIISAKYVYSF